MRRNAEKVIKEIRTSIPDRWDLRCEDMNTIRQMAKPEDFEADLIIYGWLLGFADGMRYQKSRKKEGAK